MLILTRGAITEVSPTDLYGVGNQTYEGGYKYCWVKNKSVTGTTAMGTSLFLNGTKGEVTNTVSGLLTNLPAGLAIAAAHDTDIYGWILVDGYADSTNSYVTGMLKTTASAVALNQKVIASQSIGLAGFQTVGVAATTTPYGTITETVAGKITAASTACAAYIKSVLA